MFNFHAKKNTQAGSRCFHAKSTSEEKKGAKAAVRNTFAHLAENRFVLNTDVRSYYASIDHQAILDRLAPFKQDRRLWKLLVQYLKRCSERGGLFWKFTRGIPLGCPLSPVLGSFFLHELDARLEMSGLFYMRFMDDILVLAPTHWKLRRAVKTVNQALDTLLLEKQPEKAFMGRVEKGFDFLGYHFRPGRLEVSASTKRRFAEHALRLYEREQGQSDCLALLGEYVRRWQRWAVAGLREPLPSQCPYNAQQSSA